MNFEVLQQLSDLKNPPQKETGKYTHGIHPYPAKFIPQIPHQLISAFTNERHRVLDPFSGCGTTLLEAKLLGRESVGVDLNPIGILIGRVKTYTVQSADLAFFERFKERLVSFQRVTIWDQYWIPDIPRIDHWFSRPAIQGLSFILNEIRTVEHLDRRRILNLVFSAIIVNVSNQDSETRFAAKPKDIDITKVLSTFVTKLNKVLKDMVTTAAVEKFNTATATLHLKNTMQIEDVIPANSIDLIVTSPPYLNSFDYYLYHKFRIFWLSYPENLDEMIPVSEMQSGEIGSRNKYSGPNGGSVNIFATEMKKCFLSFNRVLKPTKLLFLIVGDSVVKGDFMQMDHYYEGLLSECGFKLLAKASGAMSGASRSFVSATAKHKHYEYKQSHILAFQTINIDRDISLERERISISPSYDPLPPIEVDELPVQIDNGSNFYINNNKVTEYTHGLAKYPAKYIPQIPRWAIQNFSLPGNLVLDPFNGSGTTAVESLLLNRNYIGTDINPLAILASEVKVKYLQPDVLETNISELSHKVAAKTIEGDVVKINFELEDFWFHPEVLGQLNLLRNAIMEIENRDVRKFFLLSLSSIIKKVSYLDEGQLKVKRDAKKVLAAVPNVNDLFFKRVKKDAVTIATLKPFASTNSRQTFITGSAFHLDQMLKKERKVDLIVTSPPYINAMNYPMYHRYELQLLGLIEPADYIKHQTDYIGTERVYVKDYRSFSPLLDGEERFFGLNQKLKTIYEQEPKRYYITKKYFEDMFIFIKHAYDILRSGGKMVLVCGTNTIRGVPINTSFELSNIAQMAGFRELFHFAYEIRKHRFKLTRHQTAGKINNDIIIVLEK